MSSGDRVPASQPAGGGVHADVIPPPGGPRRESRLRAWLADLLVGTVVGLVAGAILALNLMIFLGVEGGYEANIGEAFDHSLFAGLAVVSALIGAPVAGVMWRRRRRRQLSDQSPAASSTL